MFQEIPILTLQKQLQRLNHITMADISLREYQPKRNETIYFAGPWFTERDKLLMQASIDIANNCKGKPYDVYFPMLNSDNIGLTTEQVYDFNLQHIVKASAVVALVCTKDVGTAFEIGYAAVNAIPIHLLVYDQEDLMKSKTNLMLAMAATSCFKFDRWPKFLMDKLERDDLLTIPNKWEAIE